MILFKLDGKRLLDNLANFLKSVPINKQDNTIIDSENNENNYDDNKEARSDESISYSNSTSDDDLKSIIENEELNSSCSNRSNSNCENVEKITSSIIDLEARFDENNCLKDVTNEQNSDNQFDQLFYNSKLKQFKFSRHLNQLNSVSNHSTIVFYEKVNHSPSISLPSLFTHLNGDSLSIFESNQSSNGKQRTNFKKSSLETSSFNKSSTNPSFNNFKSSFNKIDLNKNIDCVCIISYSKCWLDKLIDFDRQLNGYDRTKIVSLSVNEKDSRTKLAISNGQHVVGYGSIKYGLQDIYLIGPLYCNNKSIASDLIKEFIRSMSIEELSKGFVLKLPNCNHGAIELMNEFGFEKQSYLVTRCFTHHIHQTSTSRIFALQSTIFSSE